MTLIGVQGMPLRVAIIGSGPSGFYAADALFKQTKYHVEVDMFDRLPTPYGLVRGGVAPDHQPIKAVTKTYEKIAADPRFRFYGYVEFGTDLTLTDLQRYYHQIIYAVGAQTDKRLGVPGEDLPGSHAATEFVAWYNGHPDYRDLKFDLSAERVAVIGNGNVAMDVVRILASSVEELGRTDIADYALDALRHSKVREIYMVGRRGPAQAAFTHKELKEFGELEEADIIVDSIEGVPDALSFSAKLDQDAQRNIKTLADYIARPPAGKPRKIIMRFLVSPTELTGNGCVEQMTLVKNQLVAGADGSIKAKATDQTETLPVGLVFRSIGYTGVSLPDVPFDSKAGVIPNAAGRVLTAPGGTPLQGQYVAGWIKRGASGVIGDNRKDAIETIEKALEDVPTLPPLAPDTATREALEALLAVRKPDYITFADWQALDQLEVQNGVALGRPRLKFTAIPDMLDAIKQAKLNV